MSSKLYTHEQHPHQPSAVSVADVHEAHKARGGFSASLALLLTRSVATMTCAYIFACLAIIGFPAFQVFLGAQVPLYVQWVSQTFIQLTMLSVIMVGQSLLGKHQEMVTEETAKNTRALLNQIMQVAKHLGAQDEQLLSIGAKSSEVKEVRIVQMQHESILVAMKGDLDTLARAVEVIDRRLQALQKKASGA